MENQSVINAGFIDVMRGSMYKLSRQLIKYNVQPVMWMGYSGGKTKLARNDYPNCEFYDYWRFNKGASFLFEDEIKIGRIPRYKRAEFLELKEKVIKMMDRQDDHGAFRYQEREALFYSLFSFFYSKVIQKKLDFIISAHSPHLPATMAFYGACQIAGIETLHFRESAVVPLSYLSRGFGSEWLKTSQTGVEKKRCKELLNSYIDSFGEGNYADIEPDYMKAQKKSNEIFLQENVSIERRVSQELWESVDASKVPDKKISYRVTAADFLSETPSVSIDNFRDGLEYKAALRELQHDLYNNALVSGLPEGRYVYFPLHYEPEKTSNPDGGAYYNIYDALLYLRSYVPPDINIIVKEHYTQLSKKYRGVFGRSHYFYRYIQSLANVYLVPDNVDPVKLIKNAELTCSQTGTSCLEAACLGKKSLMLGSNWFDVVPNIFSAEDDLSYQEIMEADIADVEIIKDSLHDWVDNYSIRGCVTGSFVRLHQNMFKEESLQDFKKTCQDVVEALKMNSII
ncbi:hypothetical protein [Salinicola halimionae]|uniref:hypothetical protein n=1 Tax=Salinicola halimionae TaxID=1949081 RepID=UPI000DA1C49C|nr:hypothetical protein [Salinicola halimionae]